MTITTVVFDLGAVLLRWQPHELLESVFPGESQQLYPQIIGHPQWRQLDAGLEEEQRAVVDFATRTGKSVGEMESFMRALRDHLIPVEESLAIFDEIRAAGFRTYVLSNMPHYMMEHYFQRDDFWHHFDGVMYSAQEKLLKPGAEIFHRLFDTFAITPAEALFIDDTAENIAASQALGMEGLIFENPTQCRNRLVELGLL